MRYEVSEAIPEDAKAIRKAVFVEEQGFHNEFDQTDDASLHIVAYDGDEPVGVCRIFPDRGRVWTLGRLAVLKPYRGQHLGADLVGTAEETARNHGADRITLHAQKRAAGFYESLGYRDMGIHDQDEGCPHMWMDKSLTVGTQNEPKDQAS
ncbi:MULTISPECIES: GNAT family N-acetyltransferase [Bifidobacterium]|uniref:GNAT family N-acetyltransferase n=1 Tax=Bifidobacterium TaxID=1678 RepID=UPI0018DD6404|nr:MULTISPECIES: GNAT family N-acetyltransferase [Bifidobacterium]MBI0142107.1 GNAT family N-acetyltransferase [Bifidobacterium choladohabitans]MBI0146874.1 GNAT family N-acetyltransferase [Bifidobacterium sp. W8104]